MRYEEVVSVSYIRWVFWISYFIFCNLGRKDVFLDLMWLVNVRWVGCYLVYFRLLFSFIIYRKFKGWGYYNYFMVFLCYVEFKIIFGSLDFFV